MAQSERGRISGRVKDPSGADAPNICVTLKTAGSTKVIAAILTDATGDYKFTGVPPGTFDVSFRYQLMLDGLGFVPRTLTITGGREEVTVPLVLLDIAPSTVDYEIDSRIEYEAKMHRDGAVEFVQIADLTWTPERQPAQGEPTLELMMTEPTIYGLSQMPVGCT